MSKVPYSQQKEARQQNTSVLLRDLWCHAPLSKAMLAQRNGLTKATVSSICSDLAALGLIRAAGQDRTGLGRPGDLIELNPSARCAIGVEISTNYSAAVLTDLCGKPLWQNSALTAVGSNQKTVLAQAGALIAEAIEQAHKHAAPLLGIGAGVPGVVNGCVNAPALGWQEVSLKQIWEKRFSMPVIVENKARAAAMAEALRGCAQGVASFVYVSVGTDVRSSVQAAVMTDGFPYRGARGCWEALVDVDREVGLVRARLASGEASVLQRFTGNGGEALDHRTIHQAAVERDALALDVVGSVIFNHALGITNLVRLFDPELVVIGHASLALPPPYKARMQVMTSMPELDVPEVVRQQLARRGVRPPTIVRSTLGPEACVLGAAALLVDEFLRTPPTVEV
jgi:predicted NBD/HSP70 family sugar kinase